MTEGENRMLDKVKCECGHVNPHGTEFCESCGKPFAGNTEELLNMRYEGVARRSQTYKKTIIDRIWNFFSSVKVAVWIIVITLIASIFGTIFPQQLYIPPSADPWQYYPEQYGPLGYAYVFLGLHNMYSSWWFVSLLVMIGVSLVICSLDRVVPLYKALKKQRVTRHPAFLSRQRIHGKVATDNPDEIFEKAKKSLAQKGYNVREEEQAVMGEKGRFSRWGPYVNHIGLIIFLIGILMRILPGFTIDNYVWVRDGQTVPVTGAAEYYIKSEGFSVETYHEGNLPQIDQIVKDGKLIPKEFKTDAVLYKSVIDPETGESSLEEVKSHSIRVNDPLVYKGLKFIQSDYRMNELSEITFKVQNKATQESIGDVQVDLYNPQAVYPLQDGYEVELREYYPDFEMDQNQKPTTKGTIPNNPAFIFMIKTPDNPQGERSWIFLGQTVEDPNNPNQYELKMKEAQVNNVSGLMVRKDISLPILMLGGLIFMIGLSMGFYWNHRRIWIQRSGQEIWLAAHTNKNWFGIQKEVDELIDYTGLAIDKETLDKEALKQDELRID